jgi:hypothetical protein
MCGASEKVVVPVVIELKAMLSERRHALLKELMAAACAMLKDHKDEVGSACLLRHFMLDRQMCSAKGLQGLGGQCLSIQVSCAHDFRGFPLPQTSVCLFRHLVRMTTEAAHYLEAFVPLPRPSPDAVCTCFVCKRVHCTQNAPCPLQAETRGPWLSMSS